MATERLIVVVDERGARVVSQKIENLGKSGKKSALNMRALGIALAAVATSKILRGLQQMADTFTNMQNRLSIVTGSSENLARVTRDLERVASTTRQSFASTADVYSRVALSVQQLGRSQSETLKFVENLNKAIVLSGASARESSAGMIQLAQGLASNRLSGDELRSVLEQLPKVADLIATHLGVTRGELRRLGEEGKLQSEVVFDAIRLADDKVKDFEGTQRTVAQSFLVAKNKLTLFIGEMDKSLGVSEAVGDAIIAITETLITFVKRVVEVVQKSELLTAAFKGLSYVLNILGKVLKFVIDSLVFFLELIEKTGDLIFTLAKLATGFGAVAEGLEKAYSGGVKFVNVVDEVGLAIERLRDKGLRQEDLTDEQIRDQLAGLPTGTRAFDIREGKIFADFQKRLQLEAEQAKTDKVRADAIKDVVKEQSRALAIAKTTDEVNKAVLRVKYELIDALGVEAVQWGGVAWTTLQAVRAQQEELQALKKREEAAKRFRSLRNSTIEALEGLRRGVDGVTQAQGRLRDIIEILDRAERFNLLTKRERLDLQGKLIDNLRDQLEPAQAVINQLEKEIELLKLNNEERARRVKLDKLFSSFQGTSRDTPEARAEITNLFDRKDAIEKLQAAESSARGIIIDLLEKEKQKQKNLDEALTNRVDAMRKEIEVQDLMRQGRVEEATFLRMVNEEMAKGNILTEKNIELIDQAAKEYAEFHKDLTILETVAKNAFQGMTDALTDFLLTGKLGFNELVDSILRDLTRLLVQKALFDAVGGNSSQGGRVLGTVPGFGATGASFVVGGSGGPDSQVALLRVSPRERVSVETERQQREADATPSEAPTPQVTVLMDPRMFTDAFATHEFERGVIEVVARNPEVMRRFNRTRR